jgi:hypothetical protein
VPKRLLPYIGVKIKFIFQGAISGYPLLVLAAGLLKPNPIAAT